jgi:hypothetical protein
MSQNKYNCTYCNYNTDKRQYWYSHIKGKKHLKNVQIAEQNNQKTPNNDKSMINNDKFMINNDKFMINNDKFMINNDKKKFICKFCNDSFSTKANMTRHIENYCKEKKKLEEEEKNKLEEENRKLEEEKKKLEEEEKIKLEEEKKKLELDNQKFIMQFFEKQAEEQRRLMEKQAEEQRKLMEEQRKREEKQAEEQRKLMEMFILSQNNNNNIKEEIMGEIKEMLKSGNNTDQSHNHHNHNSGTIFEAKQQNNLLNNLNLNYNNVISMEKFLYNMEHVNKIPKIDLEAIAYASENMKCDDLAEAIHKTIMKNCEEQTKGVINEEDGLELIPVLPVVCSDGSLRSHKEKVNKFWETVYEDNHFDKMLNIIDKRLYEVLQKKIYLEEYGKKKLFRKIKKKHTIHDMESMQTKIRGMEIKWVKNLQQLIYNIIVLINSFVFLIFFR